MGDAEPEREHAPAISLRQEYTKYDKALGCWQIGWEVRNQGAQLLTIAAVRLPHGQFKSDEQLFMPALYLAPGKTERFQTFVRCDEPPGLVTENAFVIFTVNWLGAAWRIFVRLRVFVNPERNPETVTQLITTQEVGFSGVPD
jgi:hypothetical protein